MSDIASLAAALAKAQAEFDVIRRDRTVTVTTRAGDKYTFAYAPLETILRAVAPSLAKHALALSQGIAVAENAAEYVETTLYHESGQHISNRVRVIVKAEGAQAYGSALTYARRYGVTLLLGLCADDDDDANAAEGNSAEVKSNGRHPPLPSHAEAIAKWLDAGDVSKALSIYSGLSNDDKVSAWGQLSKAHRERIRATGKKDTQTEVIQ